MKQTIAIDIDDVLSRSAEGFIAFSNRRWGMRLSPEDYQEEWAVVWGVSLDEAVQRSIDFYASGIVGEYEPYESAMPVLRRLSKRFKLVAVTSRREILKPETDSWMAKHFPGIFQELYYAGIWDRQLTQANVQETLASTKATLCTQIGVEYLIDDQLKHCISAAKDGVKAILFGDYKWNRFEHRLLEGITPASSWTEVREYFNVQS